MRISGSTVLLTGASGGIGQAIARALHQRGAQLILTGRRAEVLDPLASELSGASASGEPSVRTLAADLSVPAEVDRLVEEAGAVDILVANAALPASGALASFSMEEIDRALRTNLRAPIALAHALAPAMTARGEGHLLFISSLAGKSATAGASLYNATKYGLRGFGSALRAELREGGVGVSTIFPGFIRDAGMFADSGAKLPPGVGTRSPQDVADAVVSAIERNRGEVDVAPLGLRLGAAFSGVAPETAATFTRLVGGEKLASQIAAGQGDKR
jgi:short-subunit dehydrogenase